MRSKKFLVPLMVAVALLAVVLAVSVAQPVFGSSSAPSVWLARNAGSNHETVAFDTTALRARFVLPNGLRSVDGKSYWAAFHAGDTTALHSFDVTDGSIRATVGMEGNWELGALAATGEWLALKRVPTDSEQATWNTTGAWKTTLALVDTKTLKTSKTITLDGNFDVDALKADGSWLYLIQHLPATKPDHYQVRLYDFTVGELQQGVIVDKRNIDEVMAGYPTMQVSSPSGVWLFTLYVGMQEKHAFIHALNVEDGYAWCIDLPSGDGNETTLEHYALAAAPDGHTIYANNAALGVFAIADVIDIGEPREIHYPASVSQPDDASAPIRTSIASADGARVLMSDAGTVWQYDTKTKQLQELKRAAMPIVGLALNADNSQLLIASADHSVTPLGLTGANTQQTNSVVTQNNNTCPVTQPPAQAFIPPAGYPTKPTYGDFWYGTPTLWTSLRPDGKWSALPYSETGYTNKVVWWTNGYDGIKDPEPALTVTGKRLDATASPLVASRATNANSPDFGGWAMMVGVDVPTLGCWEITGEYAGTKTTFVVQVTP